MLRRDR